MGRPRGQVGTGPRRRKTGGVARKAALRVLVADADAHVAVRIQAALLRDRDVAHVAHAFNGDEAVDFVMSEAPELVFVALDMPGARTATKHILSLTPDPPRVILMSNDNRYDDDTSLWSPDDDEASAEMLGWPGISGYINKADDAVEVVVLVIALSVLTVSGVSLTDGR
jgi:CheY-like chemotaxis protein